MSKFFKSSIKAISFPIILISMIFLLTGCLDSLLPVTKPRSNVSNKVKLKFSKTNIDPYFTLEKNHNNQYLLKMCIPVAKNKIPNIDSSTKLTMLVDKEDIFYFYPLFQPKLEKYDINSDVDTCLYAVQYLLSDESVQALMNAEHLELQIDQDQLLYGKVKNLKPLRKFLETVYF